MEKSVILKLYFLILPHERASTEENYPFIYSEVDGPSTSERQSPICICMGAVEIKWVVKVTGVMKYQDF